MSLEVQIRERISLYLTGRIEAADLESWLSEVTWEIDGESPATRHLAFASLRLVSETANGDWSDDQLRAQLRDLCKIPAADSDSVLPKVEAVGEEQLLGKLSAAQEGAERRRLKADEESTAFAMMGYVYLATQTQRWYESERPNGPAFRGQAKGESDTPVPPEAELALS
jgi:hypothetical protein